MSFNFCKYVIGNTSAKISLQTALIISSVLQIGAAVGLTGYLSIRNGREAVDNLAHQLLEGVSDRITLKLDHYLNTAHSINSVNVNAVRSGEINLQNLPAVHRRLILQHQQFPQVTSLLFGNPQGDFRVVHRVNPVQDSPAYVKVTPVEAGVSDPKDPSQVHLYRIDSNGNFTSYARTRQHLDVRNRPWYRDAVRTGKPGWSEVFQIGGTNVAGINAYHPVYNQKKQLLGVFSGNISLLQISEFLSASKVPKSGGIFIIERNGLIIADSVTKKPYRFIGKSGFERLSIENSNSHLMRDASRYLKSYFGNYHKIKTRQPLEFTFNNQRHFLQVASYKNGLGLDWLIVLVVPESEFMGQINSHTRTTIMLCLAALVLAVMTSIYTSRRIIRPLHYLSQSTVAIAEGNLNQEVKQSGFIEVKLLANAFNKMSHKLYIAYQQLEQKVEERTQQLQVEIYQRQQVQEALQASQRWLEAINQANPNIVYIYDVLEQQNVFCNREILAVLGYTPQEINQMGTAMLSSLVHPEDLPLLAVHNSHLELAQDGEVFECEYRIRHKNGEWRWLVSRETVFTRNAEDKLQQKLGTAYDITESKRLQAALQASEAHLNNILNSAGSAIVSFRVFADGSWEYDYYSAGHEQIFGYTTAEFMADKGLWLSQVLPEDWETLLVPRYGDIFAQQTFSVEYRIHHRDRTLRWISGTYVSRRDETQNCWFVTGVNVDITKLKQIEVSLQQAVITADAANLAKSEFLANMSHELRTPLNAILGFSQLLERDISLTPRQRENIGIINQAGEHLLCLINDILNMSKIEAGRMTLDVDSFDLISFLETLQAMLELKAASKGLSLTFDIAADLPRYVETDVMKLRQVLLNILGNAIKFTPQGEVTLRVWHNRLLETENKSGQSNANQSLLTHILHFEIQDTGVGISPHELKLIFQPFSQTEAGRKSQQGTGLGLAISQKFIHLMGGEIAVNSTPGIGTTFTFNIQVNQSQSLKTPTTTTVHSVIAIAPHQPEYRILVVDDDLQSRKFLAQMLSTIGFAVHEAENGQQAVATWSSWEPHLILMDMRMPVMDGYAATKQIKSHLQGQATVIIALTASAFPEFRTMVLSAGCDDFISKPFQQDILLEKITKHLGVNYILADKKLNSAINSENNQINPNIADLKHYLAAMPSDWLLQLYELGCECNDTKMYEFINQLKSEHSALANALTDLVWNFQFEIIIQASQKLLETTD